MTENVFIPTESAMTDLMERTFNEILESKFPKLIRKANRKDWLTTSEFEELFGISKALQKHYRDELNLPFYQEKKKILYKTDEVESWFSKRKVNK